MLTREQIQTLIAIRKRMGNVINTLPKDLIKIIADVGFNPDPNSDIATLLAHIAYGDLASAKAMLELNSALIGKASHVVTPSGLVVRYVKPYECALGGGDPEMAAMIAGYFDQFSDGAEEKAAQDAKYRQHIEDMLNPEKNPPYNFTLLIDTLMAATPEDVTAALNLDMNHDSTLRDVLAQFRKDFTPDTITGGMHFNYLHLLRGFEMYQQHHDALRESSGDNHGKLRLYSYQVLGFIQRSLPAIDRMVFARALYDGPEDKEAKIERSFKMDYYNTDFPVTAGDSSCSGIGFEYAAGGGRGEVYFFPDSEFAEFWKAYAEQKSSTLQNLCTCYEKRIRLDV